MQIFGISPNILKLDYLRKFFYVVPKIPRQVNIEASNRCNLNCRICKRKELNIPPEVMNFRKYTQIIDKLPKAVEEISFGGFGEQFMHPKIYEMIKYAKSTGKKVSITSNGHFLILKKNRANLLDSNIDILRISIETLKPGKTDGHEYSKKLLKALEELVKERNERNTKTQLMFNTVVCQSNKNQLIDIIRFGEKIGLNAVELLHFDKKQNQVEESLSKKEEIDLYNYIKKMDFKVDTPCLYDRYLGIRKFAFRYMHYCPLTFDVCHITIEGDVTPCCFGLPRYKIDNIFENSLAKIWNSKKFRWFRRNQQKVCAGCTLMRFD